MTIGAAIVVVAVLVILYAYLGFPAIMCLLAKIGHRVSARPSASLPKIAVVLPVYNEQRNVAGALDAILASNYPNDRMRVIVVSDCSTDETEAIVCRYAPRDVTLVRLDVRGGKTAAENEARLYIEDAEIIVNTDASVRLAPDALMPLILAFDDPTVGVASGRDVSVAHDAVDSNFGESGYVGYEMWVRGLETRIGGIVGASGCFFACRRNLYTELKPDVLCRDFAAALVAKESGYRAVSVNDAFCFVPRTGSLRREYERKVRTMACGLLTLLHKKNLMSPFRYGRFAWVLVSHKLVRWLVPWVSLFGGTGLILAATTETWAQIVSVGIGVSIVLGAMGWLWPMGRRMPRIIAIPAYVFCGTVAGIAAWIRVLRGAQSPAWEPTRREAS